MSRWLRYACLLVGICSFAGSLASSSQLRFVVLITSYNNERWCERNLDSVFAQNYANYRVIYVDDCSTDDTAHLVERYINKHGLKDSIRLIKNKKRHGKLYNMYWAIHRWCSPTAIILELDGDDWLKHDTVLAKFNRAYSSGDVWLAYARYRNVQITPQGIVQDCEKSIFCEPTSAWIVKKHAFRKQWRWSGLRSYYSWLFQLVKKEDLLMRRNGAKRFYSVCADRAYMYPMLEMASSHITFIPDVLLDRNISNPLNDFKINHDLQRSTGMLIARKKPYKPLKRPLH